MYNEFLNEKLSDKLRGFDIKDMEQQILNGKYDLDIYYKHVKNDNYPKLSDEFLLNYLINKNRAELIWFSVYFEFLPGIKYYIDKYYNGNVNDKNFEYNIYSLIRKNSYDIIKYLLESGYIIKSKDLLNLTADKKINELLQKYYDKQQNK